MIDDVILIGVNAYQSVPLLHFLAKGPNHRGPALPRIADARLLCVGFSVVFKVVKDRVCKLVPIGCKNFVTDLRLQKRIAGIVQSMADAAASAAAEKRSYYDGKH